MASKIELSEGKLKSNFIQFVSGEEIKALHTFRYNSLANRLIATKEIEESKVDGETITWKDFWEARKKKVGAYLDCISTLVQKEELQGLHNKDLVIDVSFVEKVEVIEKKPSIDIKQLSFEEKIRLLDLIKKTKKNQIELFGITGCTNTEKAIVSIEHEDVEGLNVTMIKQIEQPVEEVKRTITISDPTIRIRESLAKLALQKIKDAGGNLTEEERLLID
jgi:hypothetical protein